MVTPRVTTATRNDKPWKFYEGPPWFVRALFVFNVVYACAPRALPSSLPCPPAGALLLGGFVLGLFAAVLPSDSGSDVLNPQGMQQFPQYVAFFLAGCAAGENDWLSVVAAYDGPTRGFLRACVVIYAVALLFWTKACWSDVVKAARTGEAVSTTNTDLGAMFLAFGGVFAVATSLVWFQGFAQ